MGLRAVGIGLRWLGCVCGRHLLMGRCVSVRHTTFTVASPCAVSLVSLSRPRAAAPSSSELSLRYSDLREVGVRVWGL